MDGTHGDTIIHGIGITGMDVIIIMAGTMDGIAGIITDHSTIVDGTVGAFKITTGIIGTIIIGAIIIIGGGITVELCSTIIPQ
jgi:hypothetical protein